MKQQASARRFAELHHQGAFVLANAWDAASAALIAAAGMAAIGTTSSGISWSLGVADGECMNRYDAVAVVAAMVRVTTVPISADIESGYGMAAADVAETIDAVIEAGAVGANIEDRAWPDNQVLRPADEQCERLAAARAAADRHGLPFILNARTDVYLARIGEPEQREALVLERARHFASAGADCLFVPGLVELGAITRLAAAAPLPLNVLLSPDDGPNIDQLGRAGVRRISVGHTIAAAAYGVARDAAEGLLAGRTEVLRRGIGRAELQGLMAPTSR